MDQNDTQKKISIHTRVWRRFVRTQDLNFWVLLAFLPTFIVARLVVYNFPDLFLLIRGVHIHHLTYGITLLAIAGLWSLNASVWHQRIWAAVLYGVGLALAFDEFGIWIRLDDNYWVRQSYDAVVIIAVVLINIVYLSFFWKRILGLYKSAEKEEESTQNAD
jgi:hypothetical protein